MNASMLVWGFVRPRTPQRYFPTAFHRKTFVNNLLKYTCRGQQKRPPGSPHAGATWGNESGIRNRVGCSVAVAYKRKRWANKHRRRDEASEEHERETLQ